MSEKDDFTFPENEEGHETGGDAPGFDQEPEEWQDEKKLRKALKKAERKKKGSSTRILLLLLLLVVLAAAAYFFLGVPQPEPPPAPPKVVKKQPIAVPPPPKKEEPAKAQPAAGQAPEVAGKPAGELPAEGGTVPGEAPDEQVQDEQVQDEQVQDEQVQATASADEAIPPEGRQGTAVTEAPAGAEPSPGAYTVQAGAYLLKANLAAAMNKLSRMGYEPKVEEGNKEVAMTRLRLGTFPAEEAETRMEELSRVVPGVFTLPGDDGVVVYAGSYYNLDRARVLADRLYRQGIRLEEERVEIAVPLYQLSFGGFGSLEEARRAAELSREAGLDAYVSKEG